MKIILIRFLTLFLVGFSELVASERIECTLKPINRTPILSDESPLHLLDTSIATNWSGYVGMKNLISPKTNSVSFVIGAWTVPLLHPTSNITYSSTWVGIDGFASPTVEQIGTEQDFVNGSQENYAWFEMYPQGAFEIVGFPVNPGNLIEASVKYIGSGYFQLTIENVTHGVSFSVPTSYTYAPGALRNSAEWIVEAPSSNSGVLPLADFGNETFIDCKATIGSFSSPIVNNHWQHENIVMETSTGVIKAFTSSTFGNGQKFMVSWEHQ